MQAVGGQVFGHPGGDDESGDQVTRWPGGQVVMVMKQVQVVCCG